MRAQVEQWKMVLEHHLADVPGDRVTVAIPLADDETLRAIRNARIFHGTVSRGAGAPYDQLHISWVEDDGRHGKTVHLPPGHHLGLAGHRLYDLLRQSGQQKGRSLLAAERFETLPRQHQEICLRLIEDGTEPDTAHQLTVELLG